MPRISTPAVTCRISTSSPAKRNQTTNYPLDNLNWGCPGGKPNTIPWIKTNPPRRRRSRTSRTASTTRRLVTSSTTQATTWAFYANLRVHRHIALKRAVRASQLICRARDTYGEQGIWSSYQAIEHICYGPDWNKDVKTPPSQFLPDVKAGNLRDVTWITPTCANSDHPGCDSDTGPSWVASVVNAIGESQFWSSTAIFIFWDDYGGFYDPEPPQVRRLRRPGNTRTAAHHLAICEERTRFTHPLRARQHPRVRRKALRAAALGGKR